MLRARYILAFFAALFLLPSISEAKNKSWRAKDVWNRLSQQVKSQKWKNKSVHFTSKAKELGGKLGQALRFRPQARLPEKSIERGLSRTNRMMQKVLSGSAAHNMVSSARRHFIRAKELAKAGYHNLAIDKALQAFLLNFESGRLATVTSSID